MVEIPLQSVPAQEVQVILNGQNCTIRVYWRFWKLYVDLLVDSEPVFTGCMVQNCQWVNQSPSLLFSGGLVFVDSLGDETPRWDGLDERWALIYLDEDEILDVEATAKQFIEDDLWPSLSQEKE